MPPELVVLVDDGGTPIGTAPKDSVHSENTPLHLAFSAYGFNENGDLLVTRRALGKRTWPGVWTNTCCGHPAPGEPLEDAVRRRLHDELGLTAGRLQLVLPAFRYRAVARDGMVENEVCPVFFVQLSGTVRARSSEVSDWAWCRIEQFDQAISGTPFAFSPWAQAQMQELRAAGLLGTHAHDRPEA